MSSNHLPLPKTRNENTENFSFHYPHLAHTDAKLSFLVENEQQKANAANAYKFADVSDAVKMSVDVENEFLPAQSEQKTHAGHAHSDQFSTNCDIGHNLMHFNSDCVHNVPVDSFPILKTEAGMGMLASYCMGSNSMGSSRVAFSRFKKVIPTEDGIPEARISLDKCEKMDFLRKKCLPKKRLGNEELAQTNYSLRKNVFESSVSTIQSSAIGTSLKDAVPKIPTFSPLSTETGVTLEGTLDLSDPPYLCRFCLRGFITELDRDSHEVYHTTPMAKPFQCAMCEKTFKHEAHLVQHVHTHAGQPGQGLQSYVTEERKSPRKKNSKKPFKCFQCGKSFTKETNLSQHVKTHSCHKPYTCDFCGKSFAKTICLKQHINTHTGEKPFKCRYCAAAFSHSGSLYHHEKGQHKHDGAKIATK